MLFSHCAARGGKRSPASGVIFRAGVFAFVGALIVWSPGASAAGSDVAIGGTPITKIAAAKYYSFQPWATDVRKKPLKFSVGNKPAWARFDATTGRLFGTPIPANIGTYRNIIISVSDGAQQATLAPFAIAVGPLQNQAPQISGTPPATAVVGQSYVFQPAGHDPDGNRLTFYIWNKPSWLTLDWATGRLHGTPTAANVGTYKPIVLSVTDGYAASHLSAFSITVSPATATNVPVSPPVKPSGGSQVPVPPSVSVSSVSLDWMPPTENTDSSPLTDLAGYHVYYGHAPDALGNRIDVANPGIARYVVDNLAPGAWYFALSAYNTSGVEGELSEVIGKTIQ